MSSRTLVALHGAGGPSPEDARLLEGLSPPPALIAEDGRLPDGAPAPRLVLILPGVVEALAVARRARAKWPEAHLLIVRRPGELDAFRRSLGVAPMLGRAWSLASSEPEVAAAALRRADAAARQRQSVRAIADQANATLAASQAVPRMEYQRLRAADLYLASFLRQTSEAFIGLRRDLQVVFWSRGAERLLGHPAPEALGRELARLPPWGPRLAQAASEALGSRSDRTIELAIDTSGGTRTLECAFAHLDRLERAEDPQLSIVLRDVTDRRATQTRLESLVEERTRELQKSQLALIQAQKLEAVGKLTGGIAHDFNNLLQVIGGNLQLLQGPLGEGPERQALLRAGMSAVERGAKLASQLLAFARRQPLSPVPLNISRHVQEMDDLLRRSLGEQIQIETVLAAGLWTALVDPVQLENTILNMAINARDAMPDGGRLTIETANCVLDDSYAADAGDLPPGQYVMLAVSDTGAGMPPEVLAHVFEPFFTTKPEGKGTGLGLSMAYGFVKQSGGHIRIYSEPGSGTSIKMYLPRSLEREVRPPAAPAAPVTGGSETILVVEDDPAVQAAAVRMLQALGYQVLRAGDAQAALSILESGAAVDLLFTDVVMPGPLRSPELARRARLLLPDIAILYTSGYTQNAIVHGGRLDPGVELLSKPYRQEDLARKVRQLLARPQPPAPGRAAANRRRVLLVDDEPDLLATTRMLLELMGYEVCTAATADEAERALGESPFDALITDVNLPGRSGLELVAAARARHPAIRVIVSSGYGDALELPPGVHAVLPKPYGPDDLQRVLG